MRMAVNDVNEVGHYGSDFFLQCHQGLYQGVKDKEVFLPQM